ncbi:MAG: beta-propeller domain-containing protein, partial [Moorella sp. (in: Bacteria)]|nr:beta-propeller domain-containing protein [Moorella sp. (in: firmicutes)]
MNIELRRLLLLLSALVLALVIPVASGSISALPNPVSGAAFGAPGTTGGTGNTGDQVKDLPVVGSYENLKALLEKAQRENLRFGAGVTVMKAAEMVTGAAVADSVQGMGAQAAAPEARSGTDYSRTNVQIEGVDEADIVKTDGRYIYQVNGRRVVVARAYPAAEMQVASILEFKGEEQFTPRELYVDEQYLVVIGSTFREFSWPQIPSPSPEPQKDQHAPGRSSPAVAPSLLPGGPVKPEIYPPPPVRLPVVKAIIYDIGAKDNIRHLR